MRFLLDECVDRRCAPYFGSSHEVLHVKDVGWTGIRNGELLKRASAEFDVFVTVDSNMRFQTSAKGLVLRIAVFSLDSQGLEDYQRPIQRLLDNLDDLAPGEFTLI